MSPIPGVMVSNNGVKRYSSIKRTSEYRTVYDSGRKIVGRYYVMFWRRSGSTETRVGITVSGKVGNAVVRNRAKRRTREALRIAEAELHPQADIVLVALARVVDAPFDGLVSDIVRLLKGVS